MRDWSPGSRRNPASLRRPENVRQVLAPASAKRGFVLALGLSLLAVPLVFFLGAVAPGFLNWLEALDDFKLKPWIDLAPLGLMLASVPILRPNYRNAKAVAGLVAGAIVMGVLAVGILMVLAAGSLPNMRY